MEQVKTGAFIFATAVVIFCFVFFYILEKKNTSVRKIMLITVLTTMSIAGRFIFAPFPGFKPVTGCDNCRNVSWNRGRFLLWGAYSTCY